MSDHPQEIVIGQATSAEDLEAARVIIREYMVALGVDLSFQGFDEEMAALPGEYAAPGGLLLLAKVDGVVAGCGAFRALDAAGHAGACEMKRLYVCPAFRHLGLGRLLAQALLDRAAESGYSAMLLDTLDRLAAARKLYASLGFEEIARYNDNHLAGVLFMKARLHG